MNKWKKVFLCIKVFAPILISGLVDLWNEILDAYDKNNIAHLKQVQTVAEQTKEAINARI